MTYYCWGFPDHYTKAEAPCLRCLTAMAASRDERDLMDGDNGGNSAGTNAVTTVNNATAANVNGTNATSVNGTAAMNGANGNRTRNPDVDTEYKYEGGRGNGTWCANLLGEG